MPKILFFLFVLLLNLSSFSQTPEMYLTRGHADDIEAIALTFDGRLMASGGEDNKVFIWDVASGRMLIEIDSHKDEIEQLIFSNDGKFLLSSGADKKNYVWSTSTGNLVKTLPMNASANCIGYGPEDKYIVTGAGDATVRLWNAKTLTLVKTFNLPQYASVIEVYVPKSGGQVFTFDSQYIMAEKKSKSFISKWDLNSMTKVFRKEWKHKRRPDVLSDDGSQFFIMGAGNDPLKKYSTTNFKLEAEVSKAEWPIFPEDFLEGNTILGKIKHTGKDKKLKGRLAEFDFETNSITQVFEELNTDFDKLTLSPRKDLFVFLDEHFKTDQLTVVSREAKIVLQTTLNLSSLASSVQTHPSKPWIACNTRSASFTVLDLAKGELIRMDPKISKFASGAWFSPDGKYMIFDMYRKGIQCMDLATQTIKYTIPEKLRDPEPVFSPNSKLLSVSKDLGSTYINIIYDLETGEEKFRTPELKQKFPASVFLDNHRLYLADEKGFGIYDLNDGTYKKKTYPGLKHIEEAEAGSPSIPDDNYNVSFNQVRNLIVLGTRRTFLLIDPISFKIKNKYTWDTKLVNFISSFEASPDGNYVAGGTNTGELIIWDLNTGKSRTIKNAHTTKVFEPLRWSHDSRFLISYANDGGIKFWDPKTGAFIAQYVNVDDEEYLIYTNENYYYATKGALPFIGFKLKSKIYPYEQFDLKFNRPDKVLQKFAYADKLKEKMLFLAYQKRLKRLGFTEEKLAGDFHVPEIEVLDREKLPILTADDKLSFSIKAYDGKYPLRSINVFVNDVPILGRKGGKLASAAGKYLEKPIELQLSPGRNNIKISVKNDQGTESTREGFMVYCTKEFARGDLYLLTIGVSEYEESERNLTYAAKDARDLSEQMKLSKAFSEIHSFTLLNSEATRENVEAMRDKLKAAKANDLVVVYISSHGLLDEKLDYFLAMHNTNFEDPSQGGLPYTSIENLLDDIPARNRLILIDACHSGEIDKDEAELSETIASADTKVSITFKSGPKGVKPKAGLQNSFEYMKALFADVSSGLGATIISAAGGYEYALESDGWNNGVFTYSILKALKTRDADQNSDRALQISELRDYVVDKVFELTDGAQMPTVRKQNPVINFRVN